MLFRSALDIASAEKIVFTAFGIFNDGDKISNPVGVLILTSISGIAALLAILKFKNRKQQMLFCKLLMMLQGLILVAIFFYFDSALEKVDLEEGNYGIPIVFPIVSLILVYLADRAIKKDDDLVRSVDRIR